MAIAFATSSRIAAGTWWLSVNSRANAAPRTVKSTSGTALGIPVSWNIAARYRSSRSNVIPSRAAMAAPRVGTTGVVEECRCQEVLRGDLGISCESGVGRHQAPRIDGTPASRVHSEHHRETAGENDRTEYGASVTPCRTGVGWIGNEEARLSARLLAQGRPRPGRRAASPGAVHSASPPRAVSGLLCLSALPRADVALPLGRLPPGVVRQGAVATPCHPER
jgi:hypothetical protein